MNSAFALIVVPYLFWGMLFTPAPHGRHRRVPDVALHSGCGISATEQAPARRIAPGLVRSPDVGLVAQRNCQAQTRQEGRTGALSGEAIMHQHNPSMVGRASLRLGEYEVVELGGFDRLQNHLQEIFGRSTKACNLLKIMVGERGFEPPTPWSRTLKLNTLSALLGVA